MNKIIKNILLLIFTTLFLISCDVANVSSSSSNVTSQNTLAALLASSENLTGTNFKVASNSFGVETINTVEWRVLTITFSNGELDLTDTNLAKISLFPLQDAAAAADLYIRGSAIAYSSYTYVSGVLKLYYADAALSSQVELEISNTITADNGAKKLNQDGDEFVGADGEEEVSDVYYALINSPNTTANPVTALGVGSSKSNNPQSITVINNAGYDQTTGIITMNSFSGTLIAYTAASLDGDIKFETFSFSTNTWTEASVSTSYNSTTGVLTHQVTPIIDKGVPYRYSYNINKMAQATADEGYIRRGNHDNFLGNNLKEVTGVVDPGSYFTGHDGSSSVAVGNSDKGSLAVDITFSTNGGGSIIPGSLTADNVKIFVTESGGERTQVTYSTTVTEIADDKFRFILNNSLFDFTGSSGTIIDVVCIPTIKVDNGTSVETDDLYFGNSGNTLGIITFASGGL